MPCLYFKSLFKVVGIEFVKKVRNVFSILIILHGSSNNFVQRRRAIDQLRKEKKTGESSYVVFRE